MELFVRPNADVAGTRGVGASAGSVWNELTIAVPAYARPLELVQLLRSVEELQVLPAELLICEDGSKERQQIGEVIGAWTSRLESRGCRLTYVENDSNLGYDGNVRKLFREASGKWVMLLGNDDLMLPAAIRETRAFALEYPDVPMISTAYVKFHGSLEHIVGLSRLSERNRVFDRRNAAPAAFVKAAGFVGGLVFRRSFALEASTDAYDGTLYYQMYLAALAYCGQGIGYVCTPTVASRVGNAPLFGAASAERAVHRPGRYSPEARLAMWAGILRICQDVERQTGVSLMRGVRQELARNQSFHVFEAVAVQGRAQTWHLARGLARMGLMSGWRTWSVTLVSMALGRQVAVVFYLARGVQTASGRAMERLRALAARAVSPR